MPDKLTEEFRSNFRVIPKRKLSQAEQHMLMISIEKMRLQREKALLILGGSIVLFLAFIVIAIVGLLNELLTRDMLNMLVIVGLASLVVGVIPYGKFVIKEEKALERTLDELTN